MMRKIKSLNYIITAKNYGGSVCEYLKRQAAGILKSRGITVKMDMDAEPVAHSVQARIWQGQWIADCECGGASFVDPAEPIFFCFGCGNRADDGRLRQVIFPENIQQIETLVLERPVDDLAGLTDNERAGLARPLIVHEERGGLARNWTPDETIDDLIEQNKLIDAWNKDTLRVK